MDLLYLPAELPITQYGKSISRRYDTSLHRIRLNILADETRKERLRVGADYEN